MNPPPPIQASIPRPARAYRHTRLLLLLGFFILTGPLPRLLAGNVHLRVMTHWYPQAQFAGYYVAQEEGFYQEEGLHIELLHGGTDRPALHWLTHGKTDIASTFLSAAIQERDAGVPIISIAQWVQQSALLLIVRARSDILSPADLDGRVVTVWPAFDLQPRALFQQLGIEPVILPQIYSFNLFLRGGADAVSAMWYNEYHALLNSGLNEDELRVFRYDDYELNFPEDGLYTTREHLEQNPDALRRFVRATKKGWLHAFEHPEETIDLVLRQAREANIPTTRVRQRWMLDRMNDLLIPEGRTERMGRLSKTDYERVARTMLRHQIINEMAPFDDFHEDTL